MTTPFSTVPQTYPGAAPTDAPLWRTGGFKFYLGRPDTMMIELPSPDGGQYTANGTSGDVEHGLFGGASAVTTFASMMRRWQFQWPRLAGRDWQVVNGFYRRLFGDDPWCFVAPEDINHLTLAQSMCGALNGAVEGWGVSAGTLTYDPTLTPAVYPGGVLRWHSAPLGELLTAGIFTATVESVDTTKAAPLLQPETTTISFYAATASGTASIQPRLVGFAADGSYVTSFLGATVGLTTTAQRITYTVPPGTMTSSVAYVALSVRSGSTGAPDYLISGAQLEYNATVSDWAAGTGVPRVVLVAGVGRALDLHMNSAATLNLAEAIVGVA